MIPEIVIPEIEIDIVIEWEIITILPSLVCANEEPIVECSENLCSEVNCLGFPTAICKIDACGECSVIFTDLLSGLAVDCGKQMLQFWSPKASS